MYMHIDVGVLLYHLLQLWQLWQLYSTVVTAEFRVLAVASVGFSMGGFISTDSPGFQLCRL
jgi:hypothetical protein